MTIKIEDFLPGIKEHGLNTNEDVNIGGSLTVSGNLNSGSSGLVLVNATAENTISVDQNGNVGTAVATDGAVHIENTGNTGIGLGVYTNIGATADAPLVYIKSNNAAFDQIVVCIENEGVNIGFQLVQRKSNQSGMYVTSSGSEAFTGTGDTSLARIRCGNASDSGTAFRVQHAGTGKAVHIHAVTGTHLHFTGDPANSSSADGDVWFDGTNLKINVGGTVYNIDKTAA